MIFTRRARLRSRRSAPGPTRPGQELPPGRPGCRPPGRRRAGRLPPLAAALPPPPPWPPPPSWPPPPPPSAGPRRSFLRTSAVAQRRLGPISSATISILERCSPSGVSQERCSRRPVTSTRAPLVSDSLAFSAISRQQTTSKNDTASFFSLVWRSFQTRLTASPKVAVAWPLGVKRSSGSRVTLPTRVTLFPFGHLSVTLRSRRCGVLLQRRHRRRKRAPPARWKRPIVGADGAEGAGRACRRGLLGQADDLVAEHARRPGAGCGRGRTSPPARPRPPAGRSSPRACGRSRRPAGACPSGRPGPGVPPREPDELGGSVDLGPDDVVVERGVDDDHDLVRAHVGNSLPLDLAW